METLFYVIIPKQKDVAIMRNIHYPNVLAIDVVFTSKCAYIRTM